MGAFASKLKCIYLPAQSGKTRKMEDKIKEYTLLAAGFGDGDINIIISANNILLAKQTEARMHADMVVDDAIIQGSIFSWTSGTKASNISVRDLTYRIIYEGIEMVVVCAHPARLKYLNDMLTLLSASPHFKKNINVWIDEADKSINLWQKYASVLSLASVNQVTLVSATFDSVFKKYGALQVMGFYKTHPECYRCLKDAVKLADDYASESAYDYVRHVMLDNRKELVQPGLCAFVPGDMTKKSHDLIADFLHTELGFVVIIINGTRKEILVPGKSAIDLRHYLTVGPDGEMPPEFSYQLAKLYKDNKWERFPLAITGFYCVERGVTFQSLPKEGVHNGFLFDYGIIPPINCKAEAYQTMARLFGNLGDHPMYRKVRIFTTSRMIDIVENQETIAVNLGRIVQEQGIMMVTKKDIKEAQHFGSYDPYESHFVPCSTKEAWDMVIAKFQEEHGKKIDDTNPFVSADQARETWKDKVAEGEWCGYRRNGWGLFDYDRDIVSDKKWGINTDGSNSRKTICYKEGLLGVAINWKNV